jgi:ABC-type thiamine transport system substrate-binding protein
MKKISRISFAILGAALLCVSAAVAAGMNKAKLNLTEKVTVAGKTLNAGNYNVQWTGDGPNVQVTLFRGKDTVATFPAQVTEGSTQNADNAYGAVQGPDGSRALTSIYIGGKHTILQLDQNSSSTQQSSDQGSK